MRVRKAMLAKHGFATLDQYLQYASMCFQCDQRDLFFGLCRESARGYGGAHLLSVARTAWNQVGEPSEHATSAMDTAAAAAVSVAAAFARMEQAALGAGRAGAGGAGVVATDAGATAAGATAAGATAAGAKAAGVKRPK